MGSLQTFDFDPSLHYLDLFVTILAALPCSDSGLTIEEGVWIPLTVSPAAYTSTLAGLSNLSKCLILPLADNNISIYSLSSYQTDYILVDMLNLSSLFTSQY